MATNEVARLIHPSLDIELKKKSLIYYRHTEQTLKIVLSSIKISWLLRRCRHKQLMERQDPR